MSQDANKLLYFIAIEHISHVLHNCGSTFRYYGPVMLLCESTLESNRASPLFIMEIRFLHSRMWPTVDVVQFSMVPAKLVS